MKTQKQINRLALFVTSVSVLVAVIAAAPHAAPLQQPIDKTAAKVEQREGLSVFILSTPAAPTEYLGTMKKNLAFSGKPDEMIRAMIRKIKKEYPSAEAVVFKNEDLDVADAVKFK